MREISDRRPPIQEDQKPEASTQFSKGRESILSIMRRANESALIADTSAMIQGILNLMVEVTLAESANFFELDIATDELVITHVCGNTEGQYLIGLRFNRQQGFSGITFWDSKIVVVGDLPGDLDWLRAVDPVSAARKKNVINLPIINQGRTIGVIQIFNFHQAEIDLLMVLGDRLAMEMGHRKEVNTTRRSNQRLLTLVDILGQVAGTLDRNRLLHLVTENASRLVGAERSSIFLTDPNTQEMIFRVAYQSPDLESSSGPDKDSAKTTAINEPDQSTQNDLFHRTHPAHFQNGEFSYFNRSAITVPLRSEPPQADPSDDLKHILGGLLVLNKPNACFQEEDAQLIHILANQASTFLQVAEMYESSGELFLDVIKALAAAVDAKDPYTQGHSQRVSDYSVLIGKELKLDENQVNDLRIGSLFHDIGKIGISDTILLKTSELTEEEFEAIKRHPQTGVNILNQVKLLEPMIPAILEHHERLDGSGYPAKLTDKHISWMGRIVAVADVFDAMTSNRPYRRGLTSNEVLSYLRENAGILYDAECVSALDQIFTRSRLAGTGNPGSRNSE